MYQLKVGDLIYSGVAKELYEEEDGPVCLDIPMDVALKWAEKYLGVRRFIEGQALVIKCWEESETVVGLWWRKKEEMTLGNLPMMVEEDMAEKSIRPIE